MLTDIEKKMILERDRALDRQKEDTELEKLERKIKSTLSKLRLRSRGIEDKGDRIVVRIELSKGTPQAKELEVAMRKIKLQRVNSSYGRWEFRKV